MFASRLFRRYARVIDLLLVAVIWTMGAAALAATPSANGWQAVGTGRSSASSANASSSDEVWRLPNGQIVPAETQSKQPATTNSLRSSQTATTALREPRKMSAPTNARPLNAAQNPTPSRLTTAVQKLAPSAAVSQTAAVVPARQPANITMRPSAHPSGHPGSPRVARAMPPSRALTNPNAARLRQRMNIASNNANWSDGAEDLPLPNAASKPVETSDPFGSDPEGYYMEGEEPYVTGPEFYNGECCDGDCCGGDCCCGEGCCEPGCGCGCGGTCGDDECCEACLNDCCSIGPGDNESCNSIRIRVPRWQELAFFGGVQGFKNPYDKDRDRGNFGFHEGFNIGAKIPYTYVGYQVGYQAAQSQLNGTESPNSGESHTQHFTTFGLFRRTTDGLQFGSAWDSLVDRRHDARTFHQIRSEISWLDQCTHEFGLAATFGIMDHEEPDDEDDLSWEAADQFLLFYRVHGKRGGEGRFFAGWTDDSDGILGADMLLPVHDRWSVQTGFTYLIPDARDGADGSREEAWNINLALVWHWGCTARTSHNNPYRPLFNVANNGSMIIDNRGN